MVDVLRRVSPPPKTNHAMTSSRMTTTTAQTAPEPPPRDSPLEGVCWMLTSAIVSSEFDAAGLLPLPAGR
jgi:hypothetical protein